MGPVWTIVVAAGSGSRFGQPKQYQPLGDRRVLDWSLRAAASTSDGVVLVVSEEHGDDVEDLVDQVVTGGRTRSGSVRAGLAVVPDEAEVILVHDGARPLASPELFAEVVAAVSDGAAAAIPAMPVTDTVRSRTSGLVDRRDLVAVQTPQAFDGPVLRKAHTAGPGGEAPEATDDASLVEAVGGEVRITPGEATNLKITYPTDLLVAEALLPGASAAPMAPARSRARSSDGGRHRDRGLR